MKMTSAISLVVLSLLWHEAQAQVDCSDQTSIQQEQMKCFEEFSVQLSSDGNQDFMTAMQNDATAFCSQGVERFRPAVECALNVPTTCLQHASVTTDILPSAGKLMDGITYICQHFSEMNPTCVQNYKSVMVQCGQIKGSQLRGLNTVVEITCAALNAAYQCMAETLTPCGQRNLEVLLTYMNDYVRPPACTRPFTAGVTAHTSSTVLMMIVTVLAFGFIC